MGRVDGGPAPAAERGGEGVFVGREHELAELLAGLDDAIAGRGRLFLVAGEPGIGKSRLAEELVRHARRRGVRVLVGRCWEAGGAPTYWPWMQALRAHVRDQAADELREELGAAAGDLAQILPEIRELVGDVPSPAPRDPEGARFRLFDEAAAFLRRASQGQPLVIVLDDLNVADTPSLLLLRFVAGELSEMRILLVCAYRDVDITPGDPLASTVRELARHPVTSALHVRGLSEEDVARLISLSAGVRPAASVVSAVYDETEGNPLFVGEVARLLAAEGRLETAASEPSWRLRIPESIREVIERRLGRLSEECNRVLTFASVIGREFRLDALERVSGLARDELLDALDAATDARVVVQVPGMLGRLRFSHALIRDTLHDALPTARRIRYHGQLGEVLEELYANDPEPHLAELAHHFFQAVPGGDLGRAIDYARRAGDRAAALYGYEDAARLYRMALEALEFRERGDDAARADLLLSLGEALARAGEDASAKAKFLEAAGIARRERLPDQLARAALGYGGRYLWVRAGGDPHVVPLLEDALAALPAGNSATRVRLMGRLACARRSDPDREPGAKLSEDAVEMARRLDDRATLAYALDAYWGAHWWYDNAAARVELATELIRVARESGDGERIAQALVAQVAALLELGRIGAAETSLAELGRVADEIRQPSQQWWVPATRAMLALFRGQFGTAEQLMDKALRLGESTQRAEAEGVFWAQSFWLRKEQGRAEGLETDLRRTAEEFWWYPMFRCFLAEFYAQLDRREDARRLFRELVANDLAALLPRDNEWLVGATTIADVCVYLEDRNAARQLYEELLPVADLNVVGFMELARGSVARSLGALATLLGRQEEAQRQFDAALAANERMGARPWLARTQYEYARMLRARDAPGDRARAVELLGTALETARALGMTTLATRIERAGGQPPTSPTVARAIFHREGEYWSIVYEGDAFRLRDSKGLRHLARLLQAPGEEVHALELVGAGAGDARVAPIEEGFKVGGLGTAGELLDPRAKAAYRQRRDELREEIEEAEAWNDPERAVRARQELEFITHELSAAVGLGGRDRHAASVAERARVNVTRAIKSALARIENESPALGSHLQRTVRTGTFCCYLPDPRLPVPWQF
jgi:tetratricopeptide (TPR) repeat protein